MSALGAQVLLLVVPAKKTVLCRILTPIVGVSLLSDQDLFSLYIGDISLPLWIEPCLDTILGSGSFQIESGEGKIV